MNDSLGQDNRIATADVKGGGWNPLFTWTREGAWQYAFVGGSLYTRHDKVMTMQDFQDLSLLPAYSFARIYPQRVDDQLVQSAIYVKMPLVCVDYGDRAEGLWFEPFVTVGGTRIPLWFSFRANQARVRFEIGLLQYYSLWRKEPDDYNDWNDSPLQQTRMTMNIDPEKVDLVLREEAGQSWVDIIRKSLEEHIFLQPRTFAVNLEHHLHRALRWLAAVHDDRSGLFLEWKWRGREGFKGGFGFNLPAYNTLASDLFHIAQVTGSDCLANWAEGCLRVLLHPEASELLPQGRVWHNTLAYDPHRTPHSGMPYFERRTLET